MKKLPLITLPIALFIVTALLFAFVVPKNGNLISSAGDYYLGQGLGALLVVCIIIDIIRWKKSKNTPSN